MSQTLVIVESPAKAKTIQKYLPTGCEVTATMGHVIDLPSSTLGIDIDDNFKPQYKPIKGKSKTLKEIKDLSKKADEVILATDPDREGEAISYHLANYLGMDLADKNRIEFHEITKGAIENAMENKRSINLNLVDAQQARRVLDRLVGYKISPVLWKKILRGLSAGRVQSVATRMIVDRENEIRAFVPQEYWNIAAILNKSGDKTPITARLHKISGEKAEVHNQVEADLIVAGLENGAYQVTSVKNSVRRKKAPPPFTTSTLQQDAYRKISFSTKKTMMVAQQLYEGLALEGRGQTGLVTYIRTDSVRIADVAQQAAKAYINETYGKNYVGGFTVRARRNANVQDAHEAIRPTELSLTPASVEKSLTKDQLRLYALIYNRFLASMMADAVFDTVSADIVCGKYELRATGSTLRFDGYLKLYDNSAAEDEDEKMPVIETGEELKKNRIVSEQKFTQPPARYTEASLVKALEEQGIGRPSTYAPTISTIQARNYVQLEDKKFVPTDLGEAVTKLMTDHFNNIVDITFTAQMEDKLDKIAVGGTQWTNVIDAFYKDLETHLSNADGIERVKLAEVVTDEKCEKCGKNLVIKNGRFGQFLACPGYPECSFTKPIEEKIDANCPQCGSGIVVRKTKKGRAFYGCKGYPECNFMSWYKPTDKICPKCGKILYEQQGRSKKLFCQDKECGYKGE